MSTRQLNAPIHHHKEQERAKRFKNKPDKLLHLGGYPLDSGNHDGLCLGNNRVWLAG